MDVCSITIVDDSLKSIVSKPKPKPKPKLYQIISFSSKKEASRLSRVLENTLVNFEIIFILTRRISLLDIGEETSRATDSHFVLHRKERENRSSEIISKRRESLH